MIDNNGNRGVQKNAIAWVIMKPSLAIVDLIEMKTTMLLIKQRKGVFYRFKSENKRLTWLCFDVFLFRVFTAIPTRLKKYQEMSQKA